MDYNGKLEELKEYAEKLKNAYIKTLGAIEFLEQSKKDEEKKDKKDK